MNKYELSSKSRALMRKMHCFNLVWCMLSVGMLFFIHLAGIDHFRIIQGIMISFVFGGETIFHCRLLDKVKEMCDERHPQEPWKARQEYKSHLFLLIAIAIIGAIGVLSLIISLLSLLIS